MKAKDYRRIAWERLGQGGWTPFFLGMLFNFAIVSVVVIAQIATQMLAQRTTGSTSGKAAVASAGGMLFVAMLVIIFARVYIEAAIRYGVSSLAVATVRRGARFGHALSGFGNVGRTIWLNLVIGMYIILWTLLLIVPGIRAKFSYRMAMFLLIDRPELSTGAIIAESKRLMEGNRWRLFCLDMSFIGWFLIAAVTLGLALFFVIPYYLTAVAAFYEDLLDNDEAGEYRLEE